MLDSDVVKFDDIIRHNSTMDSETRRALYSKIRQQIVRNFEVANQKHKKPVCRYCRVKAGQLNEYVAFVAFTETAEFTVDTSASQEQTVVNKSTSDERNVDLGKTRDHQSDNKVCKMEADNVMKIKSQNQEVLGEINQRELEKKKEEMTRDSQIQERTSRSARTPTPEVTQTSGEGKQLEVDTEVGDETGKVSEKIAEQNTTTEMLVNDQVHDAEQVDEINVMSKPDEPCEQQEQSHVMNNHDLPKQFSDKTVTDEVSILPDDGDDDVVDSREMELYKWKSDSVLQLKSDTTSDDVDLKNTEYEKLSVWLSSRIDSTTAIHRFPTLYDLPVLAPRENMERSVTWRLAEKFVPAKPTAQPALTMRKGDEHLADDGQTLKDDRKIASNVIFIGPYDTSVIRHHEVVRRRISQICDDMLPMSSADIFCVTDVGCDVNLTRVSDIVSTRKLSADQFGVYTAVDTKSSCASCVLLKLTPMTR